MIGRERHPITVKRLSSGYFHIRGVGPCNWAQPPAYPCDEETFRAHAFEEAGEAFISAALALRPWGRYDEDRVANSNARPATT